MDISYEGQYSKEEILKAQRIHLLPTPVAGVIRICLMITLGIAYIVHLFINPQPSIVGELGLLIPVFIIGYLVVLPFFLTLSSIKKITQDPDFNAPISGKITEESIIINARRSTSDLKWELFTRVKYGDDFLMLYQDNNWYNLFPHRFFENNEDWNQFQSLINLKLKDKKSTKPTVTS